VEKKSYALDPVPNSLWRHLAYRQFVCWINSWHTIGKNNRRVIAACAVKKIRERFPDLAGNYTGFVESAEN
jgi:hypothetical protein